MLASVIAIVSYVLGALGFYSIASRRGIEHAWLAWVPIGNLWLLGCISDQYQSVSKGKVKNKRKVMLGLGITYALGVIVVLVICVSMFIQLIAMGGFMFEEEFNSGIYGDEIYGEDIYIDYYDDVYDEELPAEMIGSVLAMVGAAAVLGLVAIPMMVVQYIALYDVFVSCDPDNAVLFLLLSIFLGISSFLVFAIREKDLGMPPPKPPVPPVYQNFYEQTPAYTGYQQPPMPPQPPVEPWEQKTEE